MNTNLGRHASVSASHLFKKVTCKQGKNKVTLISWTDFHYFEKGNEWSCPATRKRSHLRWVRAEELFKEEEGRNLNSVRKPHSAWYDR